MTRGTDVQLDRLDLTKLRRFVEHVPKNAVMVYVTGWHVMAAELLKRFADVAEAADAADNSEHGQVTVELHQALVILRAALNKQEVASSADPVR